jgi:hypothetical protein
MDGYLMCSDVVLDLLFFNRIRDVIKMGRSNLSSFLPSVPSAQVSNQFNPL